MPLCLCCRLFITDESELWENSSRQEAFPLNWSRSGLIKTSINFNRYEVKCRTSHRSKYKGNFLFNQTHNAPPSVHTISSVLSFTHSGEAKDCGWERETSGQKNGYEVTKRTMNQSSAWKGYSFESGYSSYAVTQAQMCNTITYIRERLFITASLMCLLNV